MSKCNHAVLGGTFDRLHLGHQMLIQTALKAAKKVTIGVTKKTLHQKKQLSNSILPYQDRVKDLKSSLAQVHGSVSVNLLPITDPYGPTLEESDIDLLVVSPLTLPGAKVINQIRQQRGLSPLPISVAKLIVDAKGEHLSSTRIRQGIVSRTGFYYPDLFQKDIILTNAQKRYLKTPQGELFSHVNQLPTAELKNSPAIALVGDFTTEAFAKNNIPFNYAVIDHRIRRQSVKNSIPLEAEMQLEVENHPGTINHQVEDIIQNIVRYTRGVINVSGEEDLLVLPLILLLPLGSLIFYGQPDQGLVRMQVTEAEKEKFANFLKQ